MKDLIKEPVQQKLFLLILIFMIAFAVIISTEGYLRHLTSQYVSSINNQRSRSTLGKIIINRLIQIEKDIYKLAGEINFRDMHIVEKRIFSSISNIEIILGTLQNGGEYTNVMAANLEGINEIKEAVSFAVDKGQGYNLEVIDLTPKILDIRKNTFDLIENKKESLSASNEKERLSAENSFIIMLKQVDTLLQRGQENSARIFYDTNQEIQRLEQQFEQSTQFFAIVRISIIAAVCIISFAVFFIINRRIRDIVKERQRVGEELQKSHDELESRVEERTAELAGLNKNLKDEIEERKKAEKKIKHLNQVLRAIRNVNQRISTEKDSDRLLKGVCNNLIQTRSYYNTWIVLFDESGGLVNTAESGLGKDFLPMIDYLKSGELTDCGQRALSRPGVVVTKDPLSTTCTDCPLAKKYNHTGAFTVRLEYDGKVYGLFSASIPRDFISDKEEQTLFKEVADDVVFALHSLELDESRKQAEEALKKSHDELDQTFSELKSTQTQLLQSEKMASVGQLAAGVAHEINNPTSFVSSNLKTLSEYIDDIKELIKKYRKLIAGLKVASNNVEFPSYLKEEIAFIETRETEVDVDFVMDDIFDLIKECKEGTERIRKIVLDLKDFAHPGEDKVLEADINKGIESTLNVVWNELKYKATVTKEYGDLPLVKCYPQQLNQVFMNLLVNAAQAIEEYGEIGISTMADNGWVEIKISDSGAGIAKDNLSKIFDPFFTTKDVGKGTGLGLNVAYNIIEKHKGTIDVESVVGKGTTFTIRIPV